MMAIQTLCELHCYTNTLQGSWDPPRQLAPGKHSHGSLFFLKLNGMALFLKTEQQRNFLVLNYL